METYQLCLTPAELKAIEEHKYFMSVRLNREVGIEEAIKDFVDNHSENWKKSKQKEDNEAQFKEIQKHKYLRSCEMGYDIGDIDATEDWVKKYSYEWRMYRESLEKNGFLRTSAIVQNDKGLHLRPTFALSKLASRFDCDVYVHKRHMEYYCFVLDGKEFIDVKSTLALLTVAAIKGEELEFIATGKDAKQALMEIRDFVNNSFPGAC